MSEGVFFVLGIDGAAWSVILSNLDKLSSFKKLIEMGKSKELILAEKPISASVWCGMFSGKLPEEHKHESYVVKNDIVRREDIKVDFVWDILHRAGKNVCALNVPFVVPPYSFGVNFKHVGFGLPTNEREWVEELESLTAKIKELLAEKPDLLIAVYTLLDRVQHFHWGEKYVVDWYIKVDTVIKEIIFDSNFLNDEANKLIVISDHGFCSFGEAKVQTLPKYNTEIELKGDHHENAFLITLGIDYEIYKPQDVFFAILTTYGILS